jgi:hypothetical protein
MRSFPVHIPEETAKALGFGENGAGQEKNARVGPLSGAEIPAKRNFIAVKVWRKRGQMVPKRPQWRSLWRGRVQSRFCKLSFAPRPFA